MDKFIIKEIKKKITIKQVGIINTTLTSHINSLNTQITSINNSITAINSKLVPVGGTTGQVLTKKSNTDNDLEWKDAGGVDENIFTAYNMDIMQLL